MLGTYCLFLTGSTALLKLLKKNKGYYYQKKHMVAVSSLLYRMKQNAMGLASISILATAVLIMVSSTVSVYAGIQDTVANQYPHQFSVNAWYDTDDGTLLTNHKNIYTTSGLMECFFLSAEEYENLTGQHLELSGHQMAVYALKDNEQDIPESLTIGDTTYECLPILEDFPISMSGFSIVDCFGFVTANEQDLQTIYELQKAAYQENSSNMVCDLVFDLAPEELASDIYASFSNDLEEELDAYMTEQIGGSSDYGFGSRIDSKWETLEYLYDLNGTLLFLGLILSLIFLFATALIIYYKQISEGWEDRNRFQILQKVGMSQEEIKGIIKSQILLVFFLPLLVAAIHTAFAFPLLTRILKILFQSDRCSSWDVQQ
jgi:putative ABC transport system permease protein